MNKYIEMKKEIEERAKEVFQIMQEYETYKGHFAGIDTIKKDYILVEITYNPNCSLDEFFRIPTHYLYLDDEEIRKDMKPKFDKNNELQKELSYYENELKKMEGYYNE